MQPIDTAAYDWEIGRNVSSAISSVDQARREKSRRLSPVVYIQFESASFLQRTSCNTYALHDLCRGISLLQLNMGKLSDITANASNTGSRLSAASMGYQSLDGAPSSENLAKKSPHFMSPTVSSTKQVNAKPSNAPGSTSTPLTSSAKARASGNWMASAAKRVGFSRASDGTPHSKKEGFAKPPKAISFPDKVRRHSPLHGDGPSACAVCHVTSAMARSTDNDSYPDFSFPNTTPKPMVPLDPDGGLL